MNLEGQIASIETANINKETLDALRNASKAMKDIHGGMTIGKVDETMEELEEQHAVSREIASALTQSSGANAVDDDELEAEFADLQQEELDSKMLRTGSVPVSDQVRRLPNAAQGERESFFPTVLRQSQQTQMLTLARTVKGKAPQQEEDDEEEELKRLQAQMAM